MTAGLAAAILGFALQIAKYDGTAAVQSEGAVEMIRNMMFWPVIITAVIGMIILGFLYKLDENTMEQAREEIKKRNMQE